MLLVSIYTPEYVCGHYLYTQICIMLHPQIHLMSVDLLKLLCDYLVFPPDLFTNPRYSNGVFLITFITILLKVISYH